MVSRSSALRCSALLVATVAAAATTSGIARAADASAAPAAAAASGGESEKEARLLFAQGQIHYSLGEYDLAVSAFRRAYELSAAPGLLFNIGQAHRLNGECKPALEAYRHFVRLVPTSEYRAEADTQIAALTVRCGEAAPPAPANRPEVVKPAPSIAPTSVPSIAAGATEAAPPRWSARRKASVALLAGGAGLGLVAGGISWWNNGRYDDWQTEDRRLANPTPGIDPATWVAQQRDNDARLRSIQRVDTIDLVLAGTAIAAVVASAVLLVIADR